MPNMIGTLRDALGRGDQKTLLFLLAIGNTIAFATWQVLLNNFVVEEVAFTGREIGVLQSLREVPGFLAFTAILVMIYLRQQTFALLSLATLGIGTAITAFFRRRCGSILRRCLCRLVSTISKHCKIH